MAYLLLSDLPTNLWRKAWGRSWPHQSSSTITMAQMSPNEDNEDVVMLEDDSTPAYSTTPAGWAYTCLHGIKSVAEACDGNIEIEDVLVIRNEYTFLRETMETGYLSSAKSMVVTGQPGIGL